MLSKVLIQLSYCASVSTLWKNMGKLEFSGIYFVPGKNQGIIMEFYAQKFFLKILSL